MGRIQTGLENEVNVRDFIQTNYKVYEGDESFLTNATKATKDLWELVMKLTKEERERGGVYDLDTEIVSTITSHKAGYLNPATEKIVGVQTDIPFKRSMQPYGGIRMAKAALESYGYKLNEKVEKIFSDYRKTHNEGVFDAYTPEMMLARKVGIITGLPDAYGRGRIIGDYRRVALYGVNYLVAVKKEELASLAGKMTEDVIRLREEIAEQIRALQELKELGNIYSFDISEPAQNASEAFQWLYLGYLAAVKEQNGAAMSLGRVSTFLDIYIERDLEIGKMTEKDAQELVDHFVMKLRLVKFARTPEYNELFSGDPTWVTESIGGIGKDGRPLVTKNSFRFLHTLKNLGPAPEPNLTILWSPALPTSFKHFCSKMSIETSSLQYENDEIMRPEFGDDYGIACCVSAMEIGKQMQLFGARANLAKALLYAINGGVDEKANVTVAPGIKPITSDYLDYNEVMNNYDRVLEWLSDLYINTLNIIHFDA